MLNTLLFVVFLTSCLSCGRGNFSSADLKSLQLAEIPVDISSYEVIQSFQESRTETQITLFGTLGQKVATLKLTPDRTQLAIELVKSGKATYYVTAKILSLEKQPPVQ